MVALTARVKFYLYAQATDMRKSFDGLCGIVSMALGRDPTSGDYLPTGGAGIGLHGVRAA
jgi:hypothetical protein